MIVTSNARKDPMFYRSADWQTTVFLLGPICPSRVYHRALMRQVAGNHMNKTPEGRRPASRNPYSVRARATQVRK